MNRKQIVDLVISVFLIVVGSIMLVFPLFNFINVKYIFVGVLLVYAILNLIQFILTYKSKDYEALFTCIASIITVIIAGNLDIGGTPWYLALSVLIWVILMSLVKLKKADYYNDRENRAWIFKTISLILFILTGLLATINLYYENDIQVLVLGFFFLVHGILELFDPIVIHLMDKK